MEKGIGLRILKAGKLEQKLSCRTNDSMHIGPPLPGVCRQCSVAASPPPQKRQQRQSLRATACNTKRNVTPDCRFRPELILAVLSIDAVLRHRQTHAVGLVHNRLHSVDEIQALRCCRASKQKVHTSSDKTQNGRQAWKHWPVWMQRYLHACSLASRLRSISFFLHSPSACQRSSPRWKFCGFPPARSTITRLHDSGPRSLLCRLRWESCPAS